MRDLSSAHVSDVGTLEQNPPKTGNTGMSGGSSPSQGEQQALLDHHPSPRPQRHPMVSQHAFTAQFDISQPPSNPQPGPCSMAAMVNTLPPVAFRPGQYPHGNQQPYNPTSSPPMVQQMLQFTGPPIVPVAGQGFYAQQPQMAQYYGNQIPQPPAVSTISPRKSMAHYPSHLMMVPQQSTCYHPPSPQYQPSAPPVPYAMVTGHYNTEN